MVSIEGEITIPFYFRFPLSLFKDRARKKVKKKLKRMYPTGRIRWLRVI